MSENSNSKRPLELEWEWTELLKQRLPLKCRSTPHLHEISTNSYKPCFQIVNVRAFSWKEGDNDVCVQVSCSMIDTSKHELIFVKTSPIPIEWNNSRWFSYISYVFCLGTLLLPSQWTCLYSVRVVRPFVTRKVSEKMYKWGRSILFANVWECNVWSRKVAVKR